MNRVSLYDTFLLYGIKMKEIRLSDFGPIHLLDVKFGDLTILLGPQASGKTLFLQMLKLLIDKDHVVQTLAKYNYIVDKQPDQILNYYFGDKLSSMWTKSTCVQVDEKVIKKGSLMETECEDAQESVFYVPAQRILSISDGRPKNFMEYDISSPYVLRNFSETLRLFFQSGMGDEHTLFPLDNRLKGGMKRSFDDTIFHGGQVVIDEQSGQKKMKMTVAGSSLPFMTWSAGQKEFMPLLMAIYCLTDPTSKVINRNNYNYVVIEEPEMGLYPQAIQAVILQVLEFINQGYKVVISTHSPVILEFAWTFKNLQKLPEHVRQNALCELFGVSGTNNVTEILKGVMNKDVRTFYFSHSSDGVLTKDISELNVASDNDDESDWGGLSQFASHASEVVSKYMAEYEGE